MSNMVESASSDRLTIQEKLLLAQAVYKYGAMAWSKISEVLLAHPCCASRPAEYFGEEALESAYVAMMTGIEINVPAPDATKPQETTAKVHLRLAQTYYFARMDELKARISTCETRFKQLMQEVTTLKSGASDVAIQAELRAVLARKYGKRLLDSWVPPSEEVMAFADGAPEPSVEVDASKADKAEKGTLDAPDQLQTTISSNPSTKSDLSPLPAEASPLPSTTLAETDSNTRGIKRKSTAKPVPVKRASRRIIDSPADETNPLPSTSTPLEHPATAENTGDDPESAIEIDDPALPTEGEMVLEDIEAVEASDEKAVEEIKEDQPSEEIFEDPIEEEQPTRGRKGTKRESNTRASSTKRVSPPPSGPSKRAASVLSTASASAPTPGAAERPKRSKRGRESTIPSERGNGDDTDDVASLKTENADTIAESRRSSIRSTRGKKARESTAPSEAAIEEGIEGEGGDDEKMDVEDSEPIKSAATSTSERPKRGRRTKEDTVPSEAAIEEEDDVEETGLGIDTAGPAAIDEDGKRGKKGTKKGELVVPVVVLEKRGRRTSRRARESSDVEMTEPDALESAQLDAEADTVPASENEDDEDTPKAEEVESEVEPDPSPKGRSKRTRSTVDQEFEKKSPEPGPSSGRAGRGRGRASSPPSAVGVNSTPALKGNKNKDIDIKDMERDKDGEGEKEKGRQLDKANQKLISSLLDSISQHRNGNVFAQPIKARDAKGYYELIKQPMDLKTLRAKIRDGKITTIEQFQRDLRLMFSNAMAFNRRDTEIWKMAKEMLRESEETILGFRSVQHHLRR